MLADDQDLTIAIQWAAGVSLYGSAGGTDEAPERFRALHKQRSSPRAFGTLYRLQETSRDPSHSACSLGPRLCRLAAAGAGRTIALCRHFTLPIDLCPLLSIKVVGSCGASPAWLAQTSGDLLCTWALYLHWRSPALISAVRLDRPSSGWRGVRYPARSGWWRSAWPIARSCVTGGGAPSHRPSGGWVAHCALERPHNACRGRHRRPRRMMRALNHALREADVVTAVV